MTNQGPTDSPDYESEKKKPDLTGFLGVPPKHPSGVVLKPVYGTTKSWVVRTNDEGAKAIDEMVEDWKASRRDETQDAALWSKLRAEAAIRIYAGDMAEDIAEAVRLADRLIAELRKAK